MAHNHIYSFGLHIYCIGKELYSIYIGLIKNLFEFILRGAVSSGAGKGLGEDNTVIYTDKVGIGTKGKASLGNLNSKTSTE